MTIIVIIITAVLYSALSKQSTQERCEPNLGQTMWYYGQRPERNRANGPLEDHLRISLRNIFEYACDGRAFGERTEDHFKDRFA